uniref:DNA-directed DNA polymerase n=1 Tax=Panagrolaimus sp. JU765 TaxID=591449 RepID=A0AC34RI45_9BILA
MLRVNYACAIVMCTICIEKNIYRDQVNCSVCGQQRIFKFDESDGESVIKKFVKWLLEKQNTKFVTKAFAAYGGRFDHIFVLKELFLYEAKLEIIKKGNKLYLVHFKAQKNYCETFFLDSYNFMPLPLSSLKSAFGLKNVLDKPFFPYAYNIPENYNKILDHLPPKEDYFYHQMTKEKKDLFDQFYDQNYCTTFNLLKELESYCEADVILLAESIVAMRQTFISLTDVDPFESSVTISGSCMKVFASKFLKPNQIAIVPETGYKAVNNASVISLKYFTFREKITGEKFQTAMSPEGEKKIGNFRVDAYESSKNLVVDFNGCAWHGHDECIKNRDKILPTGKSAEKEFEKYLERKMFIENQGFNYETVWECHVKKQLKENEQMSQFFDETIIPGYISPREFLLGGRVSPMMLHCIPEKDEEIRFFDIKSLYPSVNFQAEYPIGIPEIITVPIAEQNVNWTKPQNFIKGILQVFVVPPKNLLVPVLPYRFKKQLFFPLCKTCCHLYSEIETQRPLVCYHDENQRGFMTVVSHLELNTALSEGYVVIKFFGAYIYKEWSTELFSDYVRTFLTQKTMADGWPSELKTDEDKKYFIDEYKKRFGILIDPEKMSKNNAIRSVAKQNLNCLWGKFGQSNTHDDCTVTDDHFKIDELMNDESLKIKSVDFLHQDKLLITHARKDRWVNEGKYSNCIISGWTTSVARLRLYGYLKTVSKTPGAKVLYFDTDSVAFLCKKNNCPIRSGLFLGEMVEEYQNCVIKEFISGGAKQYALKMLQENGEKYVIKIRGITFNQTSAQLLHFEKFKQMVLHPNENECVEIPVSQICPHRTGYVKSVETTKKYKTFFKKGFVDENFNVIPYGFL